MAPSARWRLNGMMGLVYAVQGAWWPILAVHLEDLGVGGRARGWMFSTLAIASVLTPMLAGRLADRKIAGPRLLVGIYAVGSVMLSALAAGWAVGVGPTFGLLLAYWLVTAPASGLAATVALRNLPKPAEQYSGVRLWGTVGWMVTGWGVTLILRASGTGQGAAGALWVGAGLSALMALYCLGLPRTPPLERRSPDAPPTGTPLLGRRGVALYLAVAFAVSLTTPFVYQAVPPYLRGLGLPKAYLAMGLSLGQVLEIASLAVLPRLLSRLGYRASMTLGILAWVAYYTLMASRPPLWLALATILLNGVAIALFHVAGPIYLDRLAPSDRRAGAQGLFLVVTAGVGSLAGNLLAGEVVAALGEVGPRVFIVPAVIDVLAALALWLGFREPAPGGITPPRAARRAAQQPSSALPPAEGC